jgi:DNA-binding NarL/FixJ family response regulator
MPADQIKKLRILVLEDHLLVAEDICDMLQDRFEILGPAPDVLRALQLIIRGEPDGAVLDINLRGKPDFSIAEVMHGRGLPFVFLTDYSDPKIVPPVLRGAPFLRKAIGMTSLSRTITLHLISHGRTLQ